MMAALIVALGVLIFGFGIALAFVAHVLDMQARGAFSLEKLPFWGIAAAGALIAALPFL